MCWTRKELGKDDGVIRKKKTCDDVRRRWGEETKKYQKKKKELHSSDLRDVGSLLSCYLPVEKPVRSSLSPPSLISTLFKNSIHSPCPITCRGVKLLEGLKKKKIYTQVFIAALYIQHVCAYTSPSGVPGVF